MPWHCFPRYELTPASVLSPYQRVFWIGGAPDSGKSTTARYLAERYGLNTYHYDQHDVRHHEVLAKSDERMRRFMDGSLDERWVRPTPLELYERSMASFHARFPLVLEELRELRPEDTPVVAEGFGFLPELVAPLLATPDQGIWLIPADAFKLASMQQRGKPSFAARTCDPERARANLLGRDRLLAEHIEEEARAAKLPLYTVSGSFSVDAASARAEVHLLRFLPELTKSRQAAPRYWILRIDTAPAGANIALEENADAQARLVLRRSDLADGDSDTRTAFENQLQMGDRIVIMPSANEVSSLIEITGGPVTTDHSSRARSFRVEHRFDPSFRTVAHIEAATLLDAAANEQAKWIVKEVLEAAHGDGFTVDWSPLVNYF